MRYLCDQPDPALRRFGSFWAAQQRRMTWRAALAGILRRSLGPVEALQLTLNNEWHARSCNRDTQDRQLLREGRLFRRYDQQPHDIDAILTRGGIAAGRS